ncbi:uncharacterized protein roh isoform X2 [Procambarus clarkii]|uniref:uncharacterized protein roh isoform X2 n=1 Tax=Procambarus clarkii TaxID=6728 RepID=UPI001E6771B9|nr:uncharacterized protein LOC123772722 [Procambarus clarkii]
MAGKAEFKSTASGFLDQFFDRFKSNTMSDRRMKYPYTFSAKIVSFPYNYHIKNVWLFKYYIIGVGLSLPLFYKIQQLACSPANVQKFADKAAKEAAQHGH